MRWGGREGGWGGEREKGTFVRGSVRAGAKILTANFFFRRHLTQRKRAWAHTPGGVPPSSRSTPCSSSTRPRPTRTQVGSLFPSAPPILPPSPPSCPSPSFQLGSGAFGMFFRGGGGEKDPLVLFVRESVRGLHGGEEGNVGLDRATGCRHDGGGQPCCRQGVGKAGQGVGGVSGEPVCNQTSTRQNQTRLDYAPRVEEMR